MRRMHVRERLDSCLQDLRFAGRQLRRAPGFSAVVVVTLALGIGATTAIFSVINGVLLEPLPYPGADRIVQVWEIDRQGRQMQVADPNFDDLAAQSRSFSALAEMTDGGTIAVTGAAEPLRARAALVSREFFTVLGVTPVIGRSFAADEVVIGGTPAVVLSYGFWQRNFGRSTSVIGSRLMASNRAYTVVGVMPPVLDLPAGTELWMARELEPRLPSRTAHNWEVIGRLRTGVGSDAARRDVTAIAKRLKGELGDQTMMADIGLVPLREQIVGSVRPALLVLLGASIVLLLIACANVVNLLVARMATRRGEVAVRSALGGGRARLVQQFLAEALVLSLSGGAIGVLLAAAGARMLTALRPANLPRVQEVRVDLPVLFFAFSMSTLAAVALGLLTAWRGTRADLREALSQSQRSLGGAGSSYPLRAGLVVTQMAMTVVLLVSAGLLGRSLIRLLHVDPGFRTSDAVVMDVWVSDADAPVAIAARVRLYDDLIARVLAQTRAIAVGGINTLPLSGGLSNGTFIVMNLPDDPLTMADFERLARDPSRSGYADFRVASGGYFPAMHIPLIRGRLFDDRDGPTTPHVALISASLARVQWPDADPIGKVIQFGNMDGDLHPFTIVGVVGDVHEASLAAPPSPTFYAFYRQRPRAAGRFNIIVPDNGDPAPVIAIGRRILRSLDPAVPPRFQTIEQLVRGSVADRRFVLFLVGVFGAAALMLASLGIYGVTSYLVAQREREISIRMALGAGAQDVLRLVLGQGVLLALLGIVLGSVASVWATQLLGGLLYGVTVGDPLAFAAAGLLLAGVALLASYFPARRATQVDPARVLRGG